MKMKILGIFVCVLLIITSSPVKGFFNISNYYGYKIINNDNEVNYDNILDGGWLEEHDGIKIVHLKGTFYQMGFQQGYFLKYNILENIRGFHYFIQKIGITYDEYLELWNIQKNYVTPEVIEFIQGTADAVGISFEDIASIWVWEGICYSHCSSLAAWGPATLSNELIHAYSLDGPGNVKDPITGKFIQENAVLIVAEPDEGNAFMYPTFAGYVAEGGTNEKGISVCNMWSPNNDGTPYGTPMGIRIFETLFRASDAEEAIEIITTNKTFGYNFIVCDGKTPVGYAIETTANHTYVGTWDHPSESIHPFWKIDYVVRRTNIFLDPTTAATQRSPYNPRVLRHILNILGGKRLIFIEWHEYKSLSRGCEKHWGTLDLKQLMLVLKNMYCGKYGLIWYILRHIYYNNIWSWCLWITCPKTGDMLISYASAETSAQYNPSHHFNLFELLESEPPF